MRLIVHLVAPCLIAVASGGLGVNGQDPSPRAKVSPEQQEKLKARDRLEKEAIASLNAGKLVEARAAVEKMLAIEEEVFGEADSHVITSLATLTELSRRLDDLAAAREYGKKYLAVCVKAHGETHWMSINARLKLADVEFRAGLPAEKRADLDKASRLNLEAGALVRRGDYAKAEPLFQEALRLNLAILGKEHADYATSLNNLGHLYHLQGQYAKAEPLYREAVRIKKEALGEKHPLYANALNNLAGLYNSQGLYAKAEPMLTEAMQIYRKAGWHNQPEFAYCMNNLGRLYHMEGNYHKAEPLLRKALELRRELLGTRHPDYTQSLNNLALLYEHQGIYAKAESLYLEALRIKKEVLGERHPSYAITLNNLARMYCWMGFADKAEPLLKQALQIRKDILGNKHPDYASSLNDLALFYICVRKFAEAEPLLKEALEIEKAALGTKHPSYALSLTYLARLYQDQQKHAEAEPRCIEALEIYKDVLGEKHPHYAAALNNLASVYSWQHQYAKAESLFREAIRIEESHQEQTAAVQSEADQFSQLAQSRRQLINLLRLPDTDPAGIYDIVFRWRGAVTTRQALARADRESNPAVRRTLDELRNVARKLTSLVAQSPKLGRAANVAKRIEELNQQYEALDRTLAAQSKEFAHYRANHALKPADLQKLLPEDAALVDFVAFGDYFAAFIVTRQKIVRVDLTVDWVHLCDLVQHFRSDGNLNLKRPAKEAASDKEDIRKVVWEPLVPHLKSAKLVLICPEGPLCRLPFAALRGSGPKKYLIEEVALAIVPAPRLLLELLGNRPAPASAPPNLLLVGDVDFGAGAGPARPSGDLLAIRGKQDTWSALPGTRIEMNGIEELFRAYAQGSRIELLRQAEATQAAVCRAAGECRYVHLATHGELLRQNPKPQFDLTGSSDILLARQGREPAVNKGVYSRLVFAGANRPTAEDDGILSALEIAELDLSGVELAVLSACETGLGNLAQTDGEASLGLQRAFLVAGARTTITSLWQIGDGVTAPLMVRFYENRLKRRMPALEALREAQLWVLNDGVAAGVVSEPLGKGLRTPPIYWAGFVLAGDWR